MYKPTHFQRGYTLLELIVSVAVFSMVMLAATTAYLSLIDLDRETRATTDVMTNLSFVVESMAREMRTGVAYACNNNLSSPNCVTASGGSSFRFTDSRGRTIVYSLVNGRVMIQINGATALPLTDPRVTVDTLQFFVRGVGTTGANEEAQPQVRFLLAGTAQVEGTDEVTFRIQSLATSRELEIPPYVPAE